MTRAELTVELQMIRADLEFLTMRVADAQHRGAAVALTLAAALPLLRDRGTLVAAAVDGDRPRSSPRA
jgi:hypothetical protein